MIAVHPTWASERHRQLGLATEPRARARERSTLVLNGICTRGRAVSAVQAITTRLARWRSSSGADDSPCDRVQTLQGSAARMAEPSRAYGTLPSLLLVRVLRVSTSRGDDDVGSGAATMRAPECTAVQQRQEGERKERKEPLALSLYASQPWKAEATAHAPRPRRAILITECHLTRTQKDMHT